MMDPEQQSGQYRLFILVYPLLLLLSPPAGTATFTHVFNISTQARQTVTLAVLQWIHGSITCCKMYWEFMTKLGYGMALKVSKSLYILMSIGSRKLF